jgi:hypothetical protein
MWALKVFIAYILKWHTDFFCLTSLNPSTISKKCISWLCVSHYSSTWQKFSHLYNNSSPNIHAHTHMCAHSLSFIHSYTNMYFSYINFLVEFPIKIWCYSNFYIWRNKMCFFTQMKCSVTVKGWLYWPFQNTQPATIRSFSGTEFVSSQEHHFRMPRSMKDVQTKTIFWRNSVSQYLYSS